MSIQKLDSWAAKVIQTSPLSILKDATLGIDATYYLETRLNEDKDEPLKHATAGLPFKLRSIIQDDINVAREAGVTLLFVFNGLDFVNKTPSDSASITNVRNYDNGWKHYTEGEQEKAENDFAKAKYPLETLYRYLRKVLRANGIEYLVAPYSAVAELSYMWKSPEQQVDAIFATTDIFLFDVDKVVLNWNSQQSTFTWLSKSVCEERAGRISGALFRDALLLLGSQFLPAFPMLERANKSNIVDAVALLTTAGRNVLQLCNQYRDDPVVQSLNYPERYKKAIMTIKHHIVLETNGTVEPLDFDHAPGDIHEFVGQRLPEELFFYLSRGLIGTDIPNWLTSGIINLTLPGGVPDSEPYRRLVVEQLNPIRAQALKIVAESLNYYYSNREVILKVWDSRDASSQKIGLKEFPSLKAKASEWKVKQADLPTAKGQDPSLLSCLRNLKDSAFAQKSFTRGRLEHPALTSKDEIISNVFWRFLQIRGYVNDKHELTNQGLILEAVLSSLEGSETELDVGVIAVEMLRLGLFNTTPIPGGAPVTQDSKSTPHTILISKIACLGSLVHKGRAYAGPLDRKLLSFAWMVAAVRVSLRNLMESVLTGMFLNGDVDREREDWMDIPQTLPFVCDYGSSLGVITKAYLDAVSNDFTDSFKKAVKDAENDGVQIFISREKDGTLIQSLDVAFGLFDAVNAGVKATRRDQEDSKVFADAEAWLAPRR